MTAREMWELMCKDPGFMVDCSSTVAYSKPKPKTYIDPLEIEKVVFNPPATIILWADKTKTVVKCQDGDEFDPEKGMAMAFMKKARGNTGAYNKEIDKWVRPYEEKQATCCIPNPEFDPMILAIQLEQLKRQISDSFGIPKKWLDNAENRKPTLKDFTQTAGMTWDNLSDELKEVVPNGDSSDSDE